MSDRSKTPEHLQELEAALPLVLTVPELCKAARVGQTTVRSAVRGGQLRAMRTAPTGSARLLIPRGEAIRWMAGWGV